MEMRMRKRIKSFQFRPDLHLANKSVPNYKIIYHNIQGLSHFRNIPAHDTRSFKVLINSESMITPGRIHAP